MKLRLDKSPKILLIFGTRPDSIKLAPVYHSLVKTFGKANIKAVATAQHRQMLDTVLDIFDIKLDHDLNIMKPRQTLHDISAAIFQKMPAVLDEEKPDLVLVHGDTSTACIASLCCFYHQVPVGHVEAGLRTPDKWIPYPEEMNRRVIDTIAEELYAPTSKSAKALKREGIRKNIYITGNTVIDALFYARKKVRSGAKISKIVSELPTGRTILVTAHRRESWGGDLEEIARALLEIAGSFPGYTIYFPIHLNPVVRENMLPILKGRENIVISDPIGYLDFIAAMDKSKIILTDSGGIQEEAPSLGAPVLVMREVTERSEGIKAGCLKLVGVDRKNIVKWASKLLSDPVLYKSMSKVQNPYGDGFAARRIANLIKAKAFNKDITNINEFYFEETRDERHAPKWICG
jgi:UDP-N-acetylglucosamine 2-epimerase (non-hydrolysing)